MRPNMILSLPNTGSDWLLNCICDTSTEIKYSREFFNPICNPKYEIILKPWFGCEMATCLEAIAKPIPKKEYDFILRNTWHLEGFNYTKENFSSFKVENHISAFNCCVLYRRLSETLPAQREWSVVENWYCAMFQSLVINIDKIDDPLKELVEFGTKVAKKFEEQYAFAFVIYYAQLLLSAKKYNLPIVELENLVSGKEEDVQNELQKIPGININSSCLVEKIIQTRRKTKKASLDCFSIIKQSIRFIPAEIQGFYFCDKMLFGCE